MATVVQIDREPSERMLLRLSDAVVLADDEEGGAVPTVANTSWLKVLKIVGVSLFVAGVVVLTASQVTKDSSDSYTRELIDGCHTAKKGENCFREVDWAKHKHIEKHPDWYVGLSKQSSFEEFQEYLHKQKTEEGIPRCPLPCGLKEAKAKTQKTMGFGKVCHTTRGGEPCFNHVKYTLRQLPDNPDWYPGLSANASIKEVQYYMYLENNNKGERVCPKPCDFTLKKKNATEQCHDATGHEPCAVHVKESMKVIEKSPHSHPGLTKNSTFAEVQAFMHGEQDADGTSICPEPCDLEAGKLCHTAIAGEPCYNDILFAMKQAEFHSEWYRGLTTNSTPEEFQAYLHGGRKDATGKKCPMPCNLTAVEAEANITKAFGDCYTATEGSQCYHDVVWTATLGYKDKKLGHWFKGISPKSQFEMVQNHLHLDPVSKCNHKACPCHTTVPGEKCYKSVMWLKHEGIKLHRETYRDLSEKSPIEELQMRLHHARQTHCPLPCLARPWPCPECDDEAGTAAVRVLKH